MDCRYSVLFVAAHRGYACGQQMEPPPRLLSMSGVKTRRTATTHGVALNTLFSTRKLHFVTGLCAPRRGARKIADKDRALKGRAGVWTAGGIGSAEFPALAKAGWPRHELKYPRSLTSRGRARADASASPTGRSQEKNGSSSHPINRYF